VYKKIAEDANRTEMRWFSNQAAVLAEKLEQDMPCAVCGSLKHPNPAVFSENELVINQAMVDQARASQAKQFKVMDAIKEAMQACLHSVTGKEQDVKQLELADHATKSLLEVEQVYRSLESDLKLIESNEKKLLRAKKQKSDKEQEREPIASDIKAIDDNIPELTALKATAKSELDAANKSLPEAYRNTVAIESVLTQVRQEIKSLETRYEVANQELTDSLNNQSSLVSTLIALNKSLDDLQARNEEQSHLWQQALADSEFATQEAFASAQMKKGALNVLVEHVRAHDDEVKTLQAELGLLERQLKDKQPPDLEKLQQNSNELNDEFTLAESIWATANQKHKELINTRDKIHKIEKQQVDIKKQYEVVGTLSKAASGRGNVRVTLERFVLGNILDSVLSIASQRLHLMSKGQYRLIRQNEEEQLKNTTAGLDLAIDDAYTGKTRPVATLSGGESFMASLALALGLSDVVQERSGGIQLDTLFIDEGFGSLDQDSLQLAINTLIDLQSAGRAIGIISHVSELKEQMAQRIEVTGSRSGSTIKMLA
jgi:exonuclease SbcC